MEVQSSYLHRNSEKEFQAQLSTYLSSAAGIIHVRTEEISRALIAIRKQLSAEKYLYKEWDIVNGFRTFTLDTIHAEAEPGDGNIDFSSAFSSPMQFIRNKDTGLTSLQCYVFVGAQQFIADNPLATQLLLQYSNILPATDVSIIIVTPDKPLPENTPVSILSLDFRPPGLGELKETLTELLSAQDIKHFSDEELDKVCYVGAGMTKHSFETYCALSVADASNKNGNVTVEDIISGVSVGKTDVVNQNDILELYPSANMNDVGGLENLKEWVRKRAKCYSDAAKEYGIEPTKGFVLVGPPGTGKSQVAKAVSSTMGVPLVRLDFGRVFNSLVGASEQRIRTALKMVASMSPNILFLDEVDKALGGIGGGGDSGVSQRVLGTFLTWMQDNKTPVMTIMTANNVSGLPPELMRRGRFDAIFSTTLPTPKERREVLAIHLRIRKRDIKDFPSNEVDEVIMSSDGYVPAEIESAVKDGLVDAFSSEEKFSMRHVKNALSAMVPLSKAFAARIAEMDAWARENATPAGKPNIVAAKEVNAPAPRRTFNRSTRTH